MKNTYKKRYLAHLVYCRDCDQVHNQQVIIPDHIFHSQKEYDGKEFTVLTLTNAKKRVRLNGSAYGLHTGGTGDMIVNPV